MATAVTQMTTTRTGGFSRRGQYGTCELITCASTPLLNGVIGTAPSADPAEVDQFAGSSRLGAVDWSIQIRDDIPHPAIGRTAADHGRSTRSSRPFLMRAVDPGEVVRLAAASVRTRPLTADDRRPVTRDLVAGTGAPAGVLSSTADDRHLRREVVEVDADPVGAVLSARVRDMVGILDLVVTSHGVRSGEDRTVLAAALASAGAEGARVAFAQVAPSHLLSYLAVGFRHVETWTVFTA